MMKRLLLSLALLASFAAQAFAAGSITLSLTQQLDTQSRPLNGGKLYTFAAGTTTPQSAYQDSALTIPYPNPITLDSAGRIPQLFFADGSIKIRLTNAAGTTQLAADGILVIGASSGGGGGSPVDATTILATGDLKVRYGTGTLSGFVRANGRTIGSATSGATERANADTQTLFEYLWDADANLTVSTGRGANAAADWAANKTIALPDWRGRAIAALGDMGNSATSVLTSTWFGTSPIVLGAAGGTQTHTLTALQAPVMAGSTTIGGLNFAVVNSAFSFGAGGSGGILPVDSGTNVLSLTVNPTGGAAHPTIPPTMLATIYLKL